MKKLLLLLLLLTAPALAQSIPSKGPTIYNPTIGTSQNNPFELYVPVLGTTSDNTKYLVLHNAAWGNSTTHIPAGTKGMLSVYEGNIDTAQAAADVTDNGHVFGCTIVQRGGAVLNCMDAVLTIQTVAPSGNPDAILAGSVARNIAGGTVFGINMNSFGSVKGDSAYHCTSTGGQPWISCISDQGGSAAAENGANLSGFSGFGDSALTNPYVIIGNTGGGVGIVGTYSNHDLRLVTNNALAMVFDKSTKQATFTGVVVPASSATLDLGGTSAHWGTIWGTALNIAGTAGADCTVNTPAHITVVKGMVSLCN